MAYRLPIDQGPEWVEYDYHLAAIGAIEPEIVTEFKKMTGVKAATVMTATEYAGLRQRLQPAEIAFEDIEMWVPVLKWRKATDIYFNIPR